jgi:catechol 2,3-dioxygenase-like lactoylglutathione lyase family enzyme
MLNHHWHSPSSLPEAALQRKMRSYTGCYFDLGDKAVATEAGGTLVHLVSDQQWVRHWLVLVAPDGSSPVLSTTLPLAFDLGEDDSAGEEPIPDVVPLDGSLDLTISADSVEEFLYRFWIENEIAFRAADGDLLVEPFASYRAHMARR